MTSTGTFGATLQSRMALHGPLCVGIDPHPALLQAWGLDVSIAGLERFAMTCVEAFGGSVAAVKPQSAFFEAFGSQGVAVLERVLAGLREQQTLSILDVKRGDIGSTMAAYAAAYLGQDSPLRADAITVSPFLGYESLRPALDLADRNSRGVFVLALTSNPQGPQVQHASYAGRSVAQAIVEAARKDNARAAALGELGSVGLVVGATVGAAARNLGIDLGDAGGPLLAPGVGAQGAGAAEIAEVFGEARPAVLASASRSVLRHGPDPTALRDSAVREADSLRAR